MSENGSKDIPEFDELIGGIDDPLLKEINEHVDSNSWLQNRVQPRCVRKVAHRALSASSEDPMSERRKRAQRQVAAELEIDSGTVYDHCARLFDGYRDADARRQQKWAKEFDSVLKTIEDDRKSDN